MRDQEQLDVRFSYAHALWLATFAVVLRRDGGEVSSRSLLRTSYGTVVKREMLLSRAVRTRRKVDPAAVVLAVALAAVATILVALHSIGA